jgi:RNA polymerase sigma-70 factor, ECF subfamily
MDNPLQPVVPPSADDGLDDFERGCLDRIANDDNSGLADLFTRHRPRLWRMVSFRMHPKLRGRVDPDDVLQDAWVRSLDRVEHLLASSGNSTYVWFRLLVCQTLADLHRRHFGAAKRSTAREFSIHGRWSPQETSSSLACYLKADGTSPSSTLGRTERAQQVDTVLNSMDPTDREVVVLRHFEQLSNTEIAAVLGMSEQATSARYVRALQKLKRVLELMPDFFDYRPA